MGALEGIVEKDPKLSTILSAPTLSADDKSAIIAELIKHAGSSGSAIKNFLDTLAENNRLNLLKGVCEKFGQIISAARGEVEMTVTSAQVRMCPIGGAWASSMVPLTDMRYRLLTPRLSRDWRLPSPSPPTSLRARSSSLPTRYAWHHAQVLLPLCLQTDSPSGEPRHCRRTRP